MVFAIWPRLALAQQPNVTTIREPHIIELADLFSTANTVALVKVVSGDAENYPITVYKAEVIKSFKGVAVEDTVYFGPYVGRRFGFEYVLFLHSVAKPLAPKTTSHVNYGTIQYSQVFNEGY